MQSNQSSQFGPGFATSQQDASISELEDLLAYSIPTDDVQTTHLQSAAATPWEDVLLKEKFQQLAIPNFYNTSNALDEDITQEKLQRMLRRGQLQLPYLTAQHESELLAEAGTFRHRNGRTYDFPPCKRGKECVCMQFLLPNQARPFVLTAMMYPDEYKQFLARNTKPAVTRPCVLCLRYTLVDWVVYTRSLKLSASTQNQTDTEQMEPCGMTLPTDSVKQSTDTEERSSPFDVYQLYYNLSDCEGGYYKEYLLQAEPSESIIQPICRLNLSFLRVQQASPGNARLVVNQNALIWSPPPSVTARVGESLQHF